ncbi:MAG: RimK/LysX family protein [Candidatus Aenigmarchaeota archaeon]
MVKRIVGLVEKIKIIGGKGSAETYALFDTGARSTSVDVKLAAKVNLGPVIRTTFVKAASLKGRIRRPVVKAAVKIQGKKFDTEVNIQDRSHMTFPVIIGRNILAGSFLVDSEKGKDIFHKLSGIKEDD